MSRPRRPFRRGHAADGFTLIEATLVIAMVGIVAAMVAVFITKPVSAYVDQARRAELSDTGDTALRRTGNGQQIAAGRAGVELGCKFAGGKKCGAGRRILNQDAANLGSVERPQV